ncbi:hypothetical protein C8F04DRAFT_716868 [Mycena alexandri]|uniref:Uncharacterized protein n=1 Tax=Mycena alexandri TaxID=1745969 RepID=A0AAD6RWW1_9AGAR|nr:hypothetical protein C8F04DRAFT_500759 [Mycena alexandri]KAJ7030591.1 hypothetical protein C8F04DRAFT_716868 [Mycena alexandri]
MSRNRTPLVQAVTEASPSRSTRQTRAKAAMVPKAKLEDREEGLGATAEGSSRSTRQTRAKDKAAKIKLEADRETASPKPSAWKVQQLKGDAPPCEVPSSFAVDHEAEVLFFNTYDEAAEHGSEIYACDMKTQTWTNITKSIMHAPRPIGSPAHPEQLPSRYGGSMAFYKSKTTGQRILFIFGGQVNGLDEHDPGEMSSELIAIDVDALKWWVVDVAGGAVAPRIESALVVVDDEIFIFGGRTYVDGELEPNRSYSICTLKAGRWTWDVRDESEIPLGQCWDAVVVQEGDAQKILLPVSVDLYDRDVKVVELRPHNFLLFDIGSRTFEADFDDEKEGVSCQWYSICPVPASLAHPSLASAVICTFQAKPRSPELYLYYLHSDRVEGDMYKRLLEDDERLALASLLVPDEPLPDHDLRSLFNHFDSECKSFGIRKRVAALKKHFEFFTVVGSKAYFWGGRTQNGTSLQRFKARQFSQVQILSCNIYSTFARFNFMIFAVPLL